MSFASRCLSFASRDLLSLALLLCLAKYCGIILLLRIPLQLLHIIPRILHRQPRRIQRLISSALRLLGVEDAVPRSADGRVFVVLGSEEPVVSASMAVVVAAPSSARAGGATVSASCRVGVMAEEAGSVTVGVGVRVWVVDARPGGAGHGVAMEEGHFACD